MTYLLDKPATDNFAVEICYDLPRFAASFNMPLQRTVIRHRVRAASASLHYAPATLRTPYRAAVELPR
jgi:hypothetical protein